MPTQTLYDGHILKLELLDDKWEIVRHAPAVAVLARRGNEVLGVRQLRRAIGEESWEVPAGLIDEGETPEEAALRELAEETQLTGRLELLTQVFSSPGFTDEKVYIFEATDLRAAEGEPDDDEDLTVSWDDCRTLWEQLRSGQLSSSGPSVIALQHALHTLK